MTYFTFLAIFVVIPIIIMLFLNRRDQQQGRTQPFTLNSWQPWQVIAALCFVAFVYTTPWDNYLVATGVWWYNPDLVTGIVFGYVPIEEYTFFLLLPILTGFFTTWLQKRLPFDAEKANSVSMRVWATAVAFIVWVLSTIAFVVTFVDPQFKPLTYLGLELSWFMIPIMIQLAFGADILWRHRRVVFTSIFLSTVYLSASDAIAIGSGTWTIDPAQSLQWYIGGVLPIEELIFFTIVNVLVVMGLTLVLAQESRERAIALGARYTLLRPLVSWIKPKVEAAS